MDTVHLKEVVRLHKVLKTYGVITSKWSIEHTRKLQEEIQASLCFIRINSDGLRRIARSIELVISSELGTLVELPEGKTRVSSHLPTEEIVIAGDPEERLLLVMEKKFKLSKSRFFYHLSNKKLVEEKKSSYPNLLTERQVCVYDITMFNDIIDNFKAGIQTEGKDGTKHSYVWRKK